MMSPQMEKSLKFGLGTLDRLFRDYLVPAILASIEESKINDHVYTMLFQNSRGELKPESWSWMALRRVPEESDLSPFVKVAR